MGDEATEPAWASQEDSQDSSGPLLMVQQERWRPCPASGLHKDISEGSTQKPSLAFKAKPPLKWPSHPKLLLV